MALHWFRGYLVILSKLVAKGDVTVGDKLILTIFDVHNKFIAFNGPMPDAHFVLSEWGSLLVITKDKKIHQLLEKDLHSKLDILFKKNLYDVAIRFVELVEVYRISLINFHVDRQSRQEPTIRHRRAG